MVGPAGYAHGRRDRRAHLVSGRWTGCALTAGAGGGVRGGRGGRGAGTLASVWVEEFGVVGGIGEVGGIRGEFEGRGREGRQEGVSAAYGSGPRARLFHAGVPRSPRLERRASWAGPGARRLT
jgi:hypothetical protein